VAADGHENASCVGELPPVGCAQNGHVAVEATDEVFQVPLDTIIVQIAQTQQQTGTAMTLGDAANLIPRCRGDADQSLGGQAGREGGRQSFPEYVLCIAQGRWGLPRGGSPYMQLPVWRPPIVSGWSSCAATSFVHPWPPGVCRFGMPSMWRFR